MRKALICMLCIVSAGLFGQGIPYGQEFQVSDYKQPNQTMPRVAVLPEGGFITCWLREKPGGYDIIGQIFDESGRKKNNEFLVNTTDYNSFMYPCVAALAGGGFVICWHTFRKGFEKSGVYGQMFDASGTKKDDEFIVDADTHVYYEEPDIVALSGGGFVLCWENWQMSDSPFPSCGRIFNASGEKKNDKFTVNGYFPGVAGLSDDGFVVCYTGEDQSQSIARIFSQRFDQSGSITGNAFPVSDRHYSTDHPKAIGLTGGGLAVCWVDFEKNGYYTDTDIYGQVLNASGVKQGHEFQVNAYTEGIQSFPSIAALSGGGFVVCWASYGQDGLDCGVYGQVFDEFGKKKNIEFRVNTFGVGEHTRPSVAALPGGGYVVCWHSFRGDGSPANIYAKLFPSSPLRHALITFLLRSPLIDTSLKSGPVDFKWNQACREIKCYSWEVVYDLYLSNDPEYTSPFVVKGIEDTTYALNNLRSGHTYFWKVLARNISGDSLWSESPDWGFFLLRGDSADVQQPTFRGFWLVNPLQNITKDQCETTLNWQRASNEKTVYPAIVHYDVLVADNPAFTNARTIKGISDTTCTVGGLSGDRTYYWKVAAYGSEGDSLWSQDVGQIQVISTEVEIPEQFRLYPNYPNPFNSGTSIRFDIPTAAEVQIDIYDIRGKWIMRLFDDNIIAGSHTFTWQGRDSSGDPVPSGIYICRLEARTSEGKKFTQSVKMGLVR